ncbi:MAG: HDOD domain-containing protein [Desulfonatronovibrionaceae bacterium]
MPAKIIHKIQSSLRNVLKASFPPSMSALVQEVSKSDPDFANIASYIRTDPGLTATVLSMANSPIYAPKERVFDLKRAVVLLGSNEILKLTVSAVFFRNMSKKKGYKLNFINWRKIVWTAEAAELIAAQICPREAQQVYIAALLKDLSLLLICFFDEEELQQARQLVCPEGEADFIRLKPGQIQKEKSAWGMDHTGLTRRLLEYWNFPAQSCAYIEDHHDLENLEKVGPGKQAVVIGTYWADLELSEYKDVNGILQLRSLISSIPDLPDIDFERLRSQVVSRFKTICSILGIGEEKCQDRVYECPLEKIQDFYFLTQGIEQEKGGVDKVLLHAATQLYWLWSVSRFAAVLKSPLTGAYHLFEYDSSAGLRTYREVAHPDGLKEEMDPGRIRIELKTASEFYGTFWVDKKNLPSSCNRDLFLYFRLLARSYEIYFLYRRDLGGKAEMMDLLPVGVARLDQQGKIVQANPVFQDFTGQKADLAGREFIRVLPVHQELVQDPEWKLFLNRQTERYSRLFCPLIPDQHREPCWHIAAHRVTLEGSVQIMALLEDISSISTLEADVLRQREFMQAMMESMQDVVLTVDERGNIMYTSPNLGRELVGKNLFETAAPAGFIPLNWGPELFKEASSPLEVTFDSGREIKSLELIVTRLSGEAPRYLVVGRDLTTIRRLEHKVKRQAVFDGLTNVYNRRQLEIFLRREVTRAWRTGSQLGVIFFDLDRFKEFNDRYGHQAGDKALIVLADTMLSQSRSGTDSPCRYGGDEFIILASDTTKQGLEQLARRVWKNFDDHFQGEITLSIGLAVLAENETRDLFLKRAEQAAYAAKEAGGNRIVWG